MQRDDILRVLKAREADLREQGIAHAGLFGSIARGDARPDSDIDIVIEIATDAKMDLFGYVGVVQYIQDLFEGPVDVADRATLKQMVRPTIERDAIYAF